MCVPGCWDMEYKSRPLRYRDGDRLESYLDRGRREHVPSQICQSPMAHGVGVFGNHRRGSTGLYWVISNVNLLLTNQTNGSSSMDHTQQSTADISQYQLILDLRVLARYLIPSQSLRQEVSSDRGLTSFRQKLPHTGYLKPIWSRFRRLIGV